MSLATLTALLKEAGVPVVSVSFVDEQDKATWNVEFAPEATPEQKSLATSIVRDFDPDAPDVKDAEQTAAARAAADSLMVKAFFRFFIYTTQGPETVIDQPMIDAASALLERCFKEASAS